MHPGLFERISHFREGLFRLHVFVFLPLALLAIINTGIEFIEIVFLDFKVITTGVEFCNSSSLYLAHRLF
jgi:hypothetical protein